MTHSALYVFSHSALDMVSTLNQYAAHEGKRKVTIVISSTIQNLRFLENAVPASAVRFLHFQSRESEVKRGLARFISQLRAERRQLDELVREIRSDPANEVVFHSIDDLQLGYVVARVAGSNRVTFIDTLETPRHALRIRDMWSGIGLKNLVHLAISTLVFGPHYRLAGTRSHPLLTMRPENLPVVRRPKSAGGTVQTLAKYRYRCPTGPDTAIVLYANRFGVDERVHTSAYRDAIESLEAHGFRIVAKVHPQSTPPALFEEHGVHCIPGHIPFEFVDLQGISVVIGLFGASLLCTGAVPTISLLDMIYDRNSDHHRSAMEQLAQSPSICFVKSRADLAAQLARIAAANVVAPS
jgi:hypothetical protein